MFCSRKWSFLIRVCLFNGLLMESSLITDLEIIKKCIPQREPIIMVDTLFEYKEHFVLAGLNIKADNIFAQNLVLSEGGLIEHMAQSVALYTGYQFYIKKEKAPTGYIGSIKTVTIESLPKVGDLIVTEVYILHEILGVTLVDIVSKCNDKVIAKAQMKTVIAN